MKPFYLNLFLQGRLTAFNFFYFVIYTNQLHFLFFYIVVFVLVFVCFLWFVFQQLYGGGCRCSQFSSTMASLVLVMDAQLAHTGPFCFSVGEGTVPTAFGLAEQQMSRSLSLQCVTRWLGLSWRQMLLWLRIPTRMSHPDVLMHCKVRALTAHAPASVGRRLIAYLRLCLPIMPSPAGRSLRWDVPQFL